MRNEFIKLNRSDKLFFAINNVVSPLGQLLTMRFKEKHSIEEIKEVTRYVLSIYPKLRSVIEPTLFSYRFKVIDDQSRLNMLFKDSFKIEPKIMHNSKDYFERRRALLNEAFALEYRLPIKFTYLPDDPRPVLFILIHHVAGDGMSLVHMMNTMLAYMNGKKTMGELNDNYSVNPLLFKKPFYKIPAQFFRSLRALNLDKRKVKKEKIIQIASTPAEYFGSSDVFHHRLPQTLEAIKAKSKEFSCSITTLLLAALACTLSKLSTKSSGDTVGIMISMDLRSFFDEKPPVFGNYVKAFMVRVTIADIDKPHKMITDIKTQLLEFRERIEKKEIIASWAKEKLLLAIGNKFYAGAFKIIKKRGHFPMTCHQSNLGSMDMLNSHGDKALLCDAISVVQHAGLFMSLSSIDGKVTTNFCYPEAEFTKNDIVAIAENFTKTLDEYLCL